MSIKTVNEALALLEAVVAEKGADYKYPVEEKMPVLSSSMGICTYVREDGSPSCIVGHVIANVAPELVPVIGHWERNERTAEYEGDSEELVVGPEVRDAGHPADYGTGSGDLFLDFPELIEPATLTERGRIEYVLSEAQRIQDSGGTWGEALEVASKHAATYNG